MVELRPGPLHPPHEGLAAHARPAPLPRQSGFLRVLAEDGTFLFPCVWFSCLYSVRTGFLLIVFGHKNVAVRVHFKQLLAVIH